jgi:hypothetical protein
MIDRPDATVGMQFTHMHQTGIGKSHWAIMITLYEITNATLFSVKIKVTAQKPGVDQCKKVTGAVTSARQQIKRFRYYGIAAEHRGRCVFALVDCPEVMFVIGAQQRDQRAGIYQPARHRP